MASDVRQLVAELRRHDAAATRGEWFAKECAISGPFTATGQRAIGIVCDGQYAKARENAAAIAWLRNHAAEIADALEMAEHELKLVEDHRDELQKRIAAFEADA